MNELEQALAALKPSAADLDRDRLMYRLGEASVRRRAALWLMVSLVTTGAAAVLGALLWLRPPGDAKVQIVHVPAPPPTVAPALVSQEVDEPARASRQATGPWTYGALQRQVLRFGEEGLPDSAAASGEDDEDAHAPWYKVPTAGMKMSSWGDR